MAVEDGMDLFGGGEVGNGDHVVAHLGNAHGAAFRGHAEDGVAGVVFAGDGMRLEPAIQLCPGELPDQNHGISHRAVRTIGIGHAVQAHGHLVQVALPVDARGLDEFLVFGYALGRFEMGLEKGADGLQVQVDDAV